MRDPGMVWAVVRPTANVYGLKNAQFCDLMVTRRYCPAWPSLVQAKARLTTEDEESRPQSIRSFQPRRFAIPKENAADIYDVEFVIKKIPNNMFKSTMKLKFCRYSARYH